MRERYFSSPPPGGSASVPTAHMQVGTCILDIRRNQPPRRPRQEVLGASPPMASTKTTKSGELAWVMCASYFLLKKLLYGTTLRLSNRKLPIATVRPSFRRRYWLQSQISPCIMVYRYDDPVEWWGGGQGSLPFSGGVKGIHKRDIFDDPLYTPSNAKRQKKKYMARSIE